MRSVFLALVLALIGCGLPPPTTAVAPSSDGTPLFIEERGPRDAPAIVFIHGLAFSHEIWRHQLEGPLAQRFHLIAFDLRGHGRSGRPTDPAAYRDLARWGDDLATVLARTNAQRPVLVGWSLGGLVIESYLAKHGSRAIGGVVLVAGVTKLAPDVFTPENATFFPPLMSSDDAVRAQGTRAFASACFAKPVPVAELDGYLAAAGVLPAWEEEAIQHLDLTGAEAALASLDRPTLVVHGGRDALLAHAMADYTLSKVRGSQQSLYEDAGHAVFVDDAARFDAELARFSESDAVARRSKSP